MISRFPNELIIEILNYLTTDLLHVHMIQGIIQIKKKSNPRHPMNIIKNVSLVSKEFKYHFEITFEKKFTEKFNINLINFGGVAIFQKIIHHSIYHINSLRIQSQIYKSIYDSDQLILYHFNLESQEKHIYHLFKTLGCFEKFKSENRKITLHSSDECYCEQCCFFEEINLD